MNVGLEGSGAFDHIASVLRRGVSWATPSAVMQSLPNLVVIVKVPFATYSAELCSTFANVGSVALIALDEATVQLAAKSGVDDKFSVLGTHSCFDCHSTH